MSTLPAPEPPKWYQVHDNLVLLTAYLAQHGHSAHDVAYAVEKPWKYEAEYNEARAIMAADGL